jgi:hypothetical protein
MSLRTAYAQGHAAALAHFGLTKSAAPTMASLNPAQSAATAMPSPKPTPVKPPTAPIAAGAEKAHILG